MVGGGLKPSFGAKSERTFLLQGLIDDSICSFHISECFKLPAQIRVPGNLNMAAGCQNVQCP